MWLDSKTCVHLGTIRWQFKNFNIRIISIICESVSPHFNNNTNVYENPKD